MTAFFVWEIGWHLSFFYIRGCFPRKGLTMRRKEESKQPNEQEVPEITGYERDLPVSIYQNDDTGHFTRKERYQQYLQSPEWAQVRDDIFVRDQGICLDCGNPAEQIHHRSYPEVMGDENYDDLVSLCGSCHRYRHEIGY
ncbi:hypothetical protein [Alcanivorax sp.]|uniref:HNH endonuclease n=1 Tax=Alcanivorax sp. TaxID=1872427 RepID=UPI0032D93BBB